MAKKDLFDKPVRSKISVSPEIISGDHLDRALRPNGFDEYIGQKDLVVRLKIALEAAKQRGEPMDHVLLISAPGLGKTSIANIVAANSEIEPKIINAPVLKTIADLIEVFKKIKTGQVLFIDEFHRLDRRAEEYLHTAMEDYRVDIKMRKSIVSIKINPFCMIGATTKPGNIPAPVRDRFGIVHSLVYYTPDELCQILEMNAKKLHLEYDKNGLMEVAGRSRGTPRIANRLLRRARDFCQLYHNNKLTKETVSQAMAVEGIEANGMTDLDRNYMDILWNVYGGGPIGVDPIAATISTDTNTIEDYIEPFLMRQGLMQRTKQGREITQRGMDIMERNNEKENTSPKK